MTDDVKKRLNVVLVAGGKWHDIDFCSPRIIKASRRRRQNTNEGL